MEYFVRSKSDYANIDFLFYVMVKEEALFKFWNIDYNNFEEKKRDDVNEESEVKKSHSEWVLWYHCAEV